MTQKEKIIATAFTGKMFIDGSEMGLLYEYMEKKVGHGVIDLMLANKGFWEELHKACEQDFIDMVSKEQPCLPSNLDEATENYYEQDCPYPGEARVVNREHDVWFPSQAIEDAFKAGAEWMAGQGASFKVNVEDVPQGYWYAGLHLGSCAEKEENALKSINAKDGEEVIVQIRKKQ